MGITAIQIRFSGHTTKDFWEARKRRNLSLQNTLAEDTLPSFHQSMGGGRRRHVSKGCKPTCQALFVEGGILGAWKEKPRLSASQSSHQGPNQDSGASGRKISRSATNPN